MLKFDQALINQVGLQHTGGSCLGYAAAYAKTITTGTVHTWAEFDYNGGAYGERVLRQEHDRRVRLPRYRERVRGAPHAL